MENIDIQQIESYLRGKMTREERGLFEATLATNPELNRRTEELRQLSEGIRQVARGDIRQRVEALREQIKQEEIVQPSKPGSSIGGKPLIFLFTGLLLGIGLGWLIFHESQTPQPEPAPVGLLPVATPQHEAIATVRIPSPIAGKYINLSVMYNPDLDGPAAPQRKYALDKGGVGLCVYTRLGDDFWKKDLTLLQSGQNFYLKIDTDKFLLKDDGEEHTFPEKPSID